MGNTKPRKYVTPEIAYSLLLEKVIIKYRENKFRLQNLRVENILPIKE